MIGVLIPLWGRSSISTKVLAHWANLSPERLRLCCVLSPEDEDPPEIPDSFHVVFHDNSDMRLKWQAGLDALRGRVDSVMVVGSDNVATCGYVDAVNGLCHDTGAACSRSIVYCDPATDRAFEARYRVVFAGAAYSADLLDRIGWNLFAADGSQGHNPDYSTVVQVMRAGTKFGRVPPLIETGEMLVDIKGPGSIWAYERVLRKAHSMRRLLREDTAKSILDNFDVFRSRP